MIIDVIGIGLDVIEGLNEKTRAIIALAELLVGSERHLSYLAEYNTNKLVLKDLGEIIPQLRTAITAQKAIAIIVSGDPLFFGLGRLLLAEFNPEQLAFHPHLSSVQLAFSRVKIPWQDAQVISIHGRSLEQLTLALQKGVAKIALLTDPENNPQVVARHLKIALPNRYDLWICENLGDSSEKMTKIEAEDIETFAKAVITEFAPLNVVILVRQDEPVAGKNLPLFGIPDEVFSRFSDRPGLMTKKEIRVLILGELALQPEQIIWDIGAGTGSVSLEIARLSPSSQIYAIEKTAMGISLIEQNCQRLQINNVTPVYGQAPAILANLPSPQRIFIGGSGGNLSSILDQSQTKLSKDGVIVMALATVEHLQLALTWLKQQQWHYHLLQVQISRSVALGDLTRFTPLNPVTIIVSHIF
jgi:precorrin-6Y C5,15-methyltransferase (decarboxylating)